MASDNFFFVLQPDRSKFQVTFLILRNKLDN
jgi:hypothetical protein